MLIPASRAVSSGPSCPSPSLPPMPRRYKGEWSKRVWRKQLATSSGPLQQRSGVAVLKLRSTGQAEVRAEQSLAGQWAGWWPLALPCGLGQ